LKRILACWLTLVCALGVTSSASAIKWLTDASYRVQTMGDAGLGIEDETTAITPFNHENQSGLVLTPKGDRVDLGLVYDMDVVDTPNVDKKTTTDLELTRPGAQYRGYTYWFNDSLVMRAGVEGMLVSSVDTPASGGTDQKMNLSGGGVGANLAYLAPFGLAVGAAVVYTGASGKPDPLPAGASKVEASASNLDWNVGAAYVLDKLGAEKNKLTFGVNLGADDDRPTVAGLATRNFADFNGVMNTEAEITGYGTLIRKYTVTNTPLKISGEAIFDMGSMLAAGVLIDDKMSQTKVKFDQTDPTGGFMGGNISTESKTTDSNIMGISPVVRANIPLGAVNLLPGLMFTTYGTGVVNQYSPNPTDPNASYKSSSTTIGSTSVAAGVGVQALDKALQAAVQVAMGGTASTSKSFDVNGNELGSGSNPDTASTTIGVGAEYKVIPMLALRAGYLTSTTTTKATAFSQESKATVGTITGGVGFSMMERASLDLLVKMSTYTSDPAPDPKPTHTNTGVYLGACIPL
jgi:hypothetical protein